MLLPYPSLRQGLVGCWVPSLGASGLTLLDRSGRNNHGTLVNMAGQDNWQASGSGVAIKTDGVDDWVSVPVDVMPLGSAARTLSCWVNKPNNTTYGIMLDAGAVSAMNRCLFMVIGAGGYSTLPNQSVVVEFNTVSAGTTSTIPLNQWVHLAATVEGTMGATRIFINGTAASMNLRGTTSNVVNTTTAQLGLFGRGMSASYGESLYDDLRIYNRILTLSEIRLLASRRGIGLTPSAPLYGDGESLKYPIVAPPNRVHANVDGVWVPGQVRANEAGVWQRGDAKVNNAGVWSPPFDPRSIPGLAAWYDAADSASVTLASGRVSQWSDKSGNARHATNTTSGSTQPSYSTAARNGLNVVRFAAASTQRLTVPSSTATFKFLHDGTPYWWIAVNTFGTVSNPGALYVLFSTSPASAERGSFVGYEDSAGVGNDAAELSVGRGVVGSPAAETTIPSRASVQTAYQNIWAANTLLVSDCLMSPSDATASERIALSVNGATAIKGNTFSGAVSTANATNNLSIGASLYLGSYLYPLQGDICELMLFNQQPTAADRTIIRQHLAAKWGVTLA